MIIGGYEPCSLSDYPGRVACVLFTQGCNWNCPFCHNRALLPVAPPGATGDTDLILERVAGQRDRLGGIVVSGGEPTIHRDLPEFLARLRTIGLPLKLDTNGSRPNMLAQILGDRLVDYIAMDVKAPLHKYRELAGKNVAAARIERSVALIAGSGIAHQFRTTVVPGLLDEDDLAELRGAGSGRLALPPAALSCPYAGAPASTAIVPTAPAANRVCTTPRRATSSAAAAAASTGTSQAWRRAPASGTAEPRIAPTAAGPAPSRKACARAERRICWK